MRCIICNKSYPEEDLQELHGKDVCSECIDQLIKSDITGGKDCTKLLEHIKLNR